MIASRAKFAAAAGSLIATGLVRYPGAAAEFTFKLSLLVPPSYPNAGAITSMIDRVSAQSGGRLEIKPFWSGTLGGETEVMNQVRLGAIEMTLIPDLSISSLVPVAGVTALPFIVASLNDLLKMKTGPFGSYVRDQLLKAGLYSFPGSWDTSGFRQIGNAVRPLNTAADMKGLKIRATQAPEEVAAIKALGASPVAMAQNEVYVNLQTHLVDGLVAGPVAFEQFKFYEVTKYLSHVDYGCSTWTCLASPTAWQQLPRNVADVVTREIDVARNQSNVTMEKIPPATEERLKTRGMVINDADHASFQKTIRDAGLYAQWKSAYGTSAWTLLERSVGHSLG